MGTARPRDSSAARESKSQRAARCGAADVWPAGAGPSSARRGPFWLIFAASGYWHRPLDESSKVRTRSPLAPRARRAFPLKHRRLRRLQQVVLERRAEQREDRRRLRGAGDPVRLGRGSASRRNVFSARCSGTRPRCISPDTMNRHAPLVRRPNERHLEVFGFRPRAARWSRRAAPGTCGASTRPRACLHRKWTRRRTRPR